MGMEVCMLNISNTCAEIADKVRAVVPRVDSTRGHYEGWFQ
jgi:hypothetical protein